MKKEDFKKAIDKIQPDIHMKSRLKTKVYISRKPHRFTRSIAALCLAAAVIFSAVLFIQPQLPDNNETEEASSQTFLPDIMKAFIVIAGAADSENGNTLSANRTLELNEDYPYGVHLKVVDIGELSATEKEKILNELNNKLSEYVDNKDFSLGISYTCGTEKYYLSQCSINEFRFDLEEKENIRSVNVKNTSIYGQMVYNAHKPTFKAPEHGNDITISGEEFDCENSGFYWDHTEEMEKALDKNINLPFSAFNDTITFTVDYIDGSKVIGVVELRFDDSGNATAVCKSYEYQKAGD